MHSFIIPGTPCTMSVSTTAPVSQSTTQSGSGVQQESSIFRNMAKDFLADVANEWGNAKKHARQGDVGKFLSFPVKFIGMCIHFSGKAIQGGNDFTSNPLRHLAGGSVKLIANLVEWAADAGSAAADTSIKIFDRAATWVLGLNKEEVSVKTPLDKFSDARHLEVAKFMEITSSFKHGIDKESIFYDRSLPPGWHPATTADIPAELMAPRKGEKFTGEKLNLHVEEHLAKGQQQKLMVICGDSWSSALRIGVFKHEKTGEVTLFFHYFAKN